MAGVNKMAIICECRECHKLVLNVGKHDKETGHKVFSAVGTTTTGILNKIDWGV